MMFFNYTEPSFPMSFPCVVHGPTASVRVIVLNISDQVTSNVISINLPSSYDAVSLNLAENPTKELLDRLRELKAKYAKPFLPKSIPPTEVAFSNAREFVLLLPLNRMFKPSINVATDGEVNFEWKGPDFRIDLGFYGNGKFSFYAAKQGSKPVVGDDAPVTGGIPKEVVAIASSV